MALETRSLEKFVFSRRDHFNHNLDIQDKNYFDLWALKNIFNPQLDCKIFEKY